MAEKISIDIPGIGQVQAEGFASEETLKKLAAALTKSSGGLAKEQKDQSKATKDLTKDTKEFATGLVAAGDNVIQSFKNLALTATSVATKFFANYDAIAKNPIKAGTDILNTAVDVTTNFVGGLASSVPVIGGFLKGVVDATGALAKLANEALAKQLDKNVESLKEYAKTGIGFANGMNDMQRVAQEAQMPMKEFSEGVTKAKANLMLLGVSGGEAAEKLAKNLGQLNKKGPGGLPSLREEIFKMGFSYEQQIDIAAQFMGQMQAAGKLEKMSKEELAKGTRDYARDLKVVADFTGKDAQAVNDRARKAGQIAILQTTLSEKQNQSMQGYYKSLERFGPRSDKAQQAFLQGMMGLAINVEGFTQGPMNDAILEMVAGAKSGAMGINQSMSAGADVLARQLPEATKYASDIGLGSIAGVSGSATELVGTINDLRQGGVLQVGMVDKMMSANEKQATIQDKLTTSLAKMYHEVNRVAVRLESVLQKNVPGAAGRTEKAAVGASKATEKAVNLIDNPFGQSGPGSEEEALQNFIKGGGKKGGQYFYNGFIRTYAKGGKIPSGDAGIVGEAGPEMVVGPGTVVNAAQMRENFAKMFEEQTKFLVNAKNPFSQALGDVSFTPDGIGGQLPYDKQTGSIIDPNIVKDLSDKSNSWQKSVAMLSDKNTEMAEGMRNSTMGDDGQLSQESISSTNKQLLEALQQMKDGVTQQTMSMAEMLKAMGVSNSHLGKVAMNTN